MQRVVTKRGTKLDETCVVRPCRQCGQRFATNDLGATFCGKCWGLLAGQGRTEEQLESDAAVIGWLALGAVALLVTLLVVMVLA